jgi:16S rRNA (guanine966-N2)-methyltransferase
VAGELGGRYIEAPAGLTTRPTTERVREAWFSVLGTRVRDARVVDLFAGSGALGIEALSRGAARAHFVESNPRAAEVLRRNLAGLELEARAEVDTRDVFVFLRDASRRGCTFDIALADPPYDSSAVQRLAETFRRDPFASVLCLEHTPGALGHAARPGWRRRYGDTELTFMTVDPEDTSI